MHTEFILEKAIKGNIKLASEVMPLAHRFNVNKLLNFAVTTMVSSVDVNTCILSYLCLKRLGINTNYEIDTIQDFIVRRLAEVSHSAHFPEISIDDLLDFVSSRLPK